MPNRVGPKARPWQIPQDVGIADRCTCIGRECPGIAIGGARTRLIRVDDDNLTAICGQPEGDRKPDDTGTHDRDVRFDQFRHNASDRARDFEMTCIQKLGHDGQFAG